ncbi:MAG TPA: hypothetical protein EYP25_05460 [Anaerolineae bacterium]|nr:hypothetical protein [Anaerolineae bacterium]
MGGRIFRFTATPIIDEQQKRIGTVVEWQDRTAEVATEIEIENLVANARSGNLDSRIPLENKDGFFLLSPATLKRPWGSYSPVPRKYHKDTKSPRGKGEEKQGGVAR